MTNKTTIFKYQLPALLWAIFIFVLCTYPFSNLNEKGIFGDLPVDKLVHFFLFLILVFLIMRGASKQWGVGNLNALNKWLILICAIGYGCLIELIQHYYTVNRQGDIWDIVADGIGGVLGMAVFYCGVRKLS